jgi:hypothetical protein
MGRVKVNSRPFLAQILTRVESCGCLIFAVGSTPLQNFANMLAHQKAWASRGLRTGQENVLDIPDLSGWWVRVDRARSAIQLKFKFLRRLTRATDGGEGTFNLASQASRAQISASCV